MRFLFLASVTSFALAMATFACSSSTTTTSEEDAGNPVRPPQNAPPDETTDAGSSSGDPPISDAGSLDGTAPGDGGGSSTAGDAGSRCLPTSIRESEANNDVASADPIPAQTGTYCGRISPGNDADFMVFTMPNQVQSFNLTIDDTTSGQIKVEPSADGEAFPFNSNNYPFKPGKPYVLKITSGNATPLEYRIKLTINL